MSKIAVIGAMEVEIDYLRQQFGAVASELPDVYIADVQNHQLIIAKCGIGKVNAAVCTQRLIDIIKPDYIINVGIAGCLSRELCLCGIVLGKELIYHDFNPSWILQKNSPFTDVFMGDEKLLALAEQACASAPDITSYRSGKIATGDCFVEDSELARHLHEDLGCDCVEMEGAAISHTCLLSKIPSLVIRSLSDFADESAALSMEQQEKLASEQAAYVVEGILNHLS